MVNNFISLFMAFLIGNPICCCAMASLFAVETEPAALAHSCCSSKIAEENQSQDQDQDQPDSCPCFLAKEKAAPETQKAVVRSSHFCAAKPPFFSDSCFTLPHLSPSVSHMAKWPPGAIFVRPIGVRLALQSSYLL